MTRCVAGSIVLCAALAWGIAILSPAESAPPYVWHRILENYGWGRVAYVLNLISFRDQLWAFENRAVRSSRDGRQWKTVTEDAGWTGSVLTGNVVLHNGAFWTIGGISGDPPQPHNEVWRSVDGKSWDRVPQVQPYPARRGHVVLAHNGEIWLFGGAMDGLERNDVWRSQDGSRWIRVVEHAAWPARIEAEAVSFRGRIWILAGSKGQELHADVWSSDDGVTWTSLSARAAWGERFRPTAVIYDDKIWILGGVGHNDSWFSSDAVHWVHAIPDSRWYPRGGLSAAELRGTLWMMGGKTGRQENSNPQDIWALTRQTSAP